MKNLVIMCALLLSLVACDKSREHQPDADAVAQDTVDATDTVDVAAETDVTSTDVMPTDVAPVETPDTATPVDGQAGE